MNLVSHCLTTHSRMNPHSHMNVQTHARMHDCMHIMHRHTHIPTHVHVHAHAHTRVHMISVSHKHAQISTHRHTRTNTHICTHTHTQIHTHARTLTYELTIRYGSLTLLGWGIHVKCAIKIIFVNSLSWPSWKIQLCATLRSEETWYVYGITAYNIS